MRHVFDMHIECRARVRSRQCLIWAAQIRNQVLAKARNGIRIAKSGRTECQGWRASRISIRAQVRVPVGRAAMCISSESSDGSSDVVGWARMVVHVVIAQLHAMTASSKQGGVDSTSHNNWA